MNGHRRGTVRPHDAGVGGSPVGIPRRPRPRAWRLVLVLAVAVLLTGTPLQAGHSVEAPDTPALLGFATKDWRTNLRTFADQAGRPPAFFNLFWTTELDWPNQWAASILDELHSLGITGYVELTTDDLRALAGGGKDAAVTAMLDSIAPWLTEDPAHRLVVAPLPEANLEHHPWGGDPALYRKAFHRLRALFRGAGLGPEEVRFVFAMNGVGMPYDDFYPGDGAVDVVGFARVNHGDPWLDYQAAFGRYIERMRTQVTTTKPILITQTGSVTVGGDRDAWLHDMFTRLAAHEQVIGANYASRVWSGSDLRVLIDGKLDPAFAAEYTAWSPPSEAAFLFDGRLDAWVEARGGQPASRYADIAGHLFEDNILWVDDRRMMGACGPDRFCPNAPTLREVMARALAAALDLPPTDTDFFVDDEDSPFEDAINRTAAARLTQGCSADRFCPEVGVSRAQMASFFVRALDLPPASRDHFTDDGDVVHEDNINRVAEAGVTRGCATDRYCPHSDISRGQMAAFLKRAFG